MKILQVTNRTFPAKGGVELHTAMISKKLVERGHEVTIVAFNSLDNNDCGYGISYQKPYLIHKPKKPSLPKEEFWNGVRILRFESKLQLFSYYWSPSMLAWLLKHAGEYDIIHTHTFRFSNNEFTVLAHLKNKVPFVVTGHDVIRLDYMGLPGLILDEVYRSTIGRMIFKLADRAIALTPTNAEEYNRYIRVPYEKIEIIPNGIDYSYFQNLPDGTELRESIGNPENVILFIGRFLQYKNPDKLILAFKEIVKEFPDTRLVMIGKDYGLLDYCKKLVNDCNLNQKVVFFENADERVKLQALNIATLGIVPSEYEGFGFVALELQASGIPTIANNNGGLKHVLIDGKTGFHIPEPTPTEIAKKVNYLLENDALRKEMAENGRTFGKKFSWDVVIEKLENVYKEVLEKSSM